MQYTNGYTLGAMPGQPGFDVAARSILGERLSNNYILFSAITLPWACRIKDGCYGTFVNICGVKDELALAVYPNTALIRSTTLPLLQMLIGEHPRLHFDANMLSISLMSLSSIYHPVIIYGAFRNWDNKTPFKECPLFYQGIDEFTADKLQACCDELLDIKNVLEHKGIDLSHVRRVKKGFFLDHYPSQSTDTSTFRSTITTNRSYEGMKHAMIKTEQGYIPNFQIRYLTEDVPCGLVYLRAIAEFAGVKTPNIDEVLNYVQKKIGKEYLDQHGNLDLKQLEGTRAPQQFGISSLEDFVKLYQTADMKKREQKTAYARSESPETTQIGKVKITSVDVYLVAVPLCKPYRVSFGTATHGHSVLIRINAEAETGSDFRAGGPEGKLEPLLFFGWGEASPLTGFSPQTPEGAFKVLNEVVGPRLIGMDACNLNAINRELNDIPQCEAFVRGAVDIACWDLLGKILKKPVHELLGGKLRDSIPLLYPFSDQSVAEDTKALNEKLDQGYRTFMLKMGSGTLGIKDEAQRVTNANKLFKARKVDARFCVDANQGWNVKEAREFCDLIEDENLMFIEQPLPKTAPSEDMRKLKTATKHRFSADEALSTMKDAQKIFTEANYEVVSIKVSKNGGITNTARLAAAANVFGVSCLCNSMLEQGVAQAAMLQIACTLPNLTKGGHCFMSTLRMKDDLTNFSHFIRDANVRVSNAPGLGIQVSMKKVKQYAKQTAHVDH
eukprot:CAMPEP_0184503992 /NCGR_PEP_ID=MMETSP0113_2-20130426/52223_1 /TAXON_ID=91329 /ORGANISM="Norrisiella sphaerica, Strain BC52" /LENGTH=726 /DNA_ID=CAMNT_0026893597 /DNA_START=455 /DNA_END=2635 /DNA_ORIENTATION=+